MKLDIVRAWKDEAYRESLSSEEQKSLLQNPIGELSDDDLRYVYGGVLSSQSSININGQTVCSDAIKAAKGNAKSKAQMEQLLKLIGIEPGDLDMSDLTS